eukprot:GEMP01032269.1.p1 GENE.GEMP01032269.1~~GEMP01032269.1.p1  ORF type:complete len:319 (+),score=39.43 GEMP01032269.1:91-1047(+)
MTKPITLLQISRPGFWLLNLWAYLGPTGQRWHLLLTPMFWFGIAYVLLPLNFLIFGLNDLSDVEIDADNPRKGNLIFGPKLPRAVLVDALKTAFWLNLACLGIILCIVDAPGYFLALFAVSIVINIIYNFEPCRFSSKSPLEFPCVISGFSCISLISCVLNDIPLPPAKYWIHLAAICVVVQLWTEYMDIKADGAKQRRTTAVVLGKKLTKCALGATLIATSVVVYQLFDDVLLYAFHIALLVVFAVLALLPDSMKSDRDFSPKSNGTVCASEIKPRSTTRRNTWIHVIASPIAIYLMLHLWSGGVFVPEQINDVSSS